MPNLNSDSTIADIQAAYMNNSTYEADNSAQEAQAFVQACMILLLRMPYMSTKDRSSITLNPIQIKQELDNARLWIALNPAPNGSGSVTGGGVRHFDLSDYRDDLGRGCGGRG